MNADLTPFVHSLKLGTIGRPGLQAIAIFMVAYRVLVIPVWMHVILRVLPTE